MKMYRLRLFHKSKTEWTEWRKLDAYPDDLDILTVQFNEPLTIEEAKAFFNNFKVK